MDCSHGDRSSRAENDFSHGDRCSRAEPLSHHGWGLRVLLKSCNWMHLSLIEKLSTIVDTMCNVHICNKGGAMV
jgi:hypothetical protein